MDAGQEGANELVPDAWCHLLYPFAMDAYDEFTVAGLARIQYLRGVSKSVRAGAALMETPYDAKVDYQEDGLKAVPYAFSGGMHFGHGNFVALSIVRDKQNGQVFAVSRGPRFSKAGVQYCYVDRIYPLARLAELLNGHAAKWSARLPDVHELGYSLTQDVWNACEIKGARAPTLTKLDGYKALVVKNQMVVNEGKTTPGVVEKHYDDFISNRIIKHSIWAPPGAPRQRPRWCKHPDLMLVKHEDGEPVKVSRMIWEYAWVGVIGTPMKTYNFGRLYVGGGSQPAAADRVHVLSRALGWDCGPDAVASLGGVTSLLAHGMRNLPTALLDFDLKYAPGQHSAVEAKLVEMADAALERREHDDAERAHFDAQMEKHHGQPKKRERRGAAAAAEHAIAESALESCNVDGSIRKCHRLQCSRADRADAREVTERDTKRVQKAAGGSEAWHREQEARKDLDFVPKKVRKRSISPFPSGEATAQSGVPSQATIDLDAFLDTL